MKLNWKQNRWMAVCLAVLAGLLVLITALVLGIRSPMLQGEPLTVTYSRYTAEEGQELLVEPDSQIQVGGRSGWSLERMRAGTTFEPALPFTLRLDGQSGNYVITPTVPLPAGQDVTLRVENAHITFKTAPTLLVLASSPRNGSTGSSAKTGIVLQFSTSSDQLDLAALEAAVSVEPPVSLRFSGSDSNKVHSYAEEGMEPGVTYTVTVAGDFASKDGLRLREPYVFSFTTASDLEQRTENLFTLAGWGKNPVYNTLPDAPPSIEAFFDAQAAPGGQPPQLAANLYAVADEERFITELAAAYNPMDVYGGYRPTSLEGLTLQSSFEMTPMSLSTSENYYDNRYVLPFPEALPEGRYLAEFTMETQEKNPDGSPYLLTRYILVQSSPMAVFFLHNNSDLTLWLNDTATGKPMADATFEMWGDISGYGKTAADGLATISDPALEVPRWDSVATFAIRSGDHTYLDGRFFGMDYNKGDPRLDYMGYLFTDRPIYMTTDTIQVWGVVRPRPGNHIENPVFTLGLSNSDTVQTVTPDENGFFRATIALKDRQPYEWAMLQLNLNDQELAYQHLRLYDYVKPVYTSTTTTTQPVYVLSRGETPQLDLNVSLFDGTPVEGFQAQAGGRWNSDVVCNPGTVTTDKAGNASAQVTITDSQAGWWPQNYEYQFTSGEDENYVSSGRLYIIHRDLMLRGKTQWQDGKPAAVITTHSIDTSRVQGPADLYTDNLRGPAVDTEVKAVLTRVEYVKKLVGTSYDFINRVSVPRYTYERQETQEKTYTLQTRGGTVTLTDLPALDTKPNVSYYLKLSAPDSAGLATSYTLWLNAEESPGYDTSDRYSLRKVIDPKQLEGQEDANGLSYSTWSLYQQFGDGEEVTFQLMNRDTPVENFQGQLLTATVQRGIGNLSVTDKPLRKLAFDESLVPNYNILGAYFDGRNIFLVETGWMSFRYEDRELDISLVTQKESYQPGDEVEVTAKVTQAIDGKPAPNTTVLLSVVDEAVFAIQEQYVSLLQDLYNPVFSPYITVYLSQNGPVYTGAGEKGGGGGENPIREKFEDTAHFNTAVTDASGTATFRFTLPDNITSWRMTTLAVDGQTFAGDSKQNAVSTMPFYLLPRMNSLLVEGDTLAIGLKGAGSAVENTDTVDYSITLEGPVKGTQSLSGGLREDSWVSFHALTPGQYTVTIQGRCNEMSDGVRLPLTVVSTGLEVTKAQTFDLTRDKTLAVDSLRWPVTVNLYDKRYRTYNQVVQNLYAYQTSPRNDALLAQKVLYDLMAASGTPFQGDEPFIADLLRERWISPLPNSEYDTDLTATLYLALPQLLPIRAMQYEVSEGAPYGDRAGSPSAYYILQAMLGVYNPKVASLGNYSYTEQLNLAVASLVQGDKASAQKTYDQLVTPNKQSLSGLDGQTALYIPAQDKDSEPACTAAALRLALLLGHADADGFMTYLLDKGSPYDPFIAEQLLYLSQRGPVPGDQVQVQYVQNGQQQTVALTGAMHTLRLTKEELQNADWRVQSGTAYADVYYTVPPQQSDPAQEKLAVTRTIQTVDGGPMKVGSLVKVTITPDFSGIDKGIGNSMVYVDDYLPSGLRYEKFDQPDTYQLGTFWLSGQNGQRLRFSADSESNRFRSIVYYARCAMPGDFTCEGPFITSTQGGAWGLGQPDTLTIQP